jgi:hypothetical protein
MSLSDVLQILFWTIVSMAIGTWIVFAYWRLRSNRIRSLHGDAPLRSSRELIWRAPGTITAEQMRVGPCGEGGAPAEPFHFVEEHDTGSNPCVSIRDARGRARLHPEGTPGPPQLVAWIVGWCVLTNSRSHQPTHSSPYRAHPLKIPVTDKRLWLQQLGSHKSERGVILANSLLTGFQRDIILALPLNLRGSAVSW